MTTTSLPNSTDPPSAFVNYLHSYSVSHDRDFSKKAIESLLKRLRDRKGELDQFVTAVTSHGHVATSCTTIPRTLDGRLQIASRKGFPHAVYAKIFRWPDLHKNELRHSAHCNSGFDMKTTRVCINPYHYERVIGAGEFTPTGWQAHPSNDTALNTAAALRGTNGSATADEARTSLPAKKLSKGGSFQQHAKPPAPASSSIAGPFADAQSMSQEELSSQGLPAYAMGVGKLNEALIQPSISMKPSGNSGIVHMGECANGKSLHHPSGSLVPSNWCSISYYEFTRRVGETYFASDCPLTETFVDGGVDASPSTNRFCIGSLTSLDRTEVVERCRRYIGRGIRLNLRGEGDIWLTVLTKSVYVQSHYLDIRGKQQQEPHKFVKYTTVKIFDLRQCYNEMRDLAMGRQGTSVGSAILPTSSQQQQQHPVDVDEECNRLCTVRVSFIKSFGPGNAQRNRIEQCPCWLEIRPTRALQILDEVLNSIIHVPLANVQNDE